MVVSKNQEKSGFSDVRRAARLSIAPMMDGIDFDAISIDWRALCALRVHLPIA